MLTLAQGKKLVKLARKSIDSWFKKKQLVFSRKEFKERQGVFVTLNTYPKKQLRGCIGFPYPTLPLADAVFEGARSAAFSDPRFEPIEERDLKKLVIEISVLTVPVEIHAVGNQIPLKVEIGKDGLIIQFAGHSGLLLPQVAVEHKMNSIDFLRASCQKAGLPGETWLNPQCRIFKFQAQIFSEKRPGGVISVYGEKKKVVKKKIVKRKIKKRK